MRIYTREVDGETTWAPVAIIMTVLVVVLAMGYFFWYAPGQGRAEGPSTVTVNTPAAPAQQSPTTVVLPGPAGADGATGATGATGASGATGTPGSDGADGATGTPGTPGTPGQPGPSGGSGESGGGR